MPSIRIYLSNIKATTIMPRQCRYVAIGMISWMISQQSTYSFVSRYRFPRIIARYVVSKELMQESPCLLSICSSNRLKINQLMSPFSVVVARSASITCTYASSNTDVTDVESSLPDINSMRAADIKNELTSYGISTKSFLEKKELISALLKARIDHFETRPRQRQHDSASNVESSETAAVRDDMPLNELLLDEVAKCSLLKASELKQELLGRGIDTKAFLEKNELVQALAEARVKNQKKENAIPSDEGYAEYNNVEVLTDDQSGPRQKQSQSEKTQQQSSTNRNPFGGIGGGGIADILKNFGGMGGSGSVSENPSGGGNNPFGASGNPFGAAMGGDAMKKAQQMMANPKVREIVMKAQSNPRIMQKVSECMSNPAALLKYQSDPEVSELIAELRKFI